MPQRQVPFRLAGLCLLAIGVPWAAAAEPAIVTVSRADCLRLVEHAPAPDTAYRPGVDVRGRPVAPADLGGGTTVLSPEAIEIDIEVDLGDRFGIPANPDLFDADARIGMVRVAPDGRATFNGQPLQDEAQFELTRRCQEIFYGRR